MGELFNEVGFITYQYLDLYTFLVPLGILGLWRWSVWIFKELMALRYKPLVNNHTETVSVVTPVYNEDPGIFNDALLSWKKNRPLEIVAVIDFSDKACINVFRQFQKKYSNLKLIITRVPGKRPALAEGIRASKGKIVALVDSDTFWPENLLRSALPPFINKSVGGVSTYQNVLNPKTFAQKVFDTQLDLRYCDDFPFLASAGDALVCLSGRTALYRKKTVLPLLPDLVNETFLGKKVISGDDKRLTYLVLANGWKLAYQANAKVYTPGMSSLSSYLKQRLRWSRNSIRADLKAMLQGWPFKHPALAFFLIDKIFQTFAVIVSPIYFMLSLLLGLWVPAAVIAIWWIVSRLVKILPHLRRRPKDVLILPFFIIFSFVAAILKLYSLFTLNTQGWITRWDRSRLPQFRFIHKVPAYFATAMTIFLLSVGIYYYQQLTYFMPFAKRQQLIAEVLAQAPGARENGFASTPESDTVPKDLIVQKYVISEGDSLSSIANRYGIQTKNLLAANISRLTNWNNLEEGTILSIPGKDTNLTLPASYNYQRIYSDPKRIVFNQNTNTIEVFGRGQIFSISEISSAIGEKYLSETSPKEWLLKANLFLHSGTSLELKKDNVRWLRLKSDNSGYTHVLAYNSVILLDGVKITSWDEEKNKVDENTADGRSYILVKDGSRMDVYNSELAYLGFPRTPEMTFSPYGVSWRISNGKLNSTLLTGEVLNSDFHHNYFGAYTFGATGMTWKGNKFHDNIKYGLDPHDDSNGFLIEGNLAYNNGSHGIILSKRCLYNTIRGNIVFNNKLHGIMLHEKSDNNIIEDNTLIGNYDGIALWNSKNNLIAKNKVHNNKRGIRANATSNDNRLLSNIITGSKQYGIYFYGGSNGNLAKNNTIQHNTNAVYIKSGENEIIENIIKQNKTGIYLTGEASGNSLSKNLISYNSKYGIYSKIKAQLKNFVRSNQITRNRKNIFAVKVPG